MGNIRLRLRAPIWRMIRACGLGHAVMGLHPKSYLQTLGWFKSFRYGFPMDKQGRPLPWLPYPLIDFLSPRLDKSMTVFEFGCGYSSLWFCRKAKSVISVESHPAWQRRMAAQLPTNGRILLRGNPQAYAQAIDSEGPFDLVLVDGINRQACLDHAMRCLTKRGVILADDSARADFRAAWPRLAAAGFREITFSGITPSHFVASQTSILYRDGNGLGI